MADEPEAWLEVGRRIRAARQALPRDEKGREISAREAARRAGISEAHWRHIESGRRLVSGVELPPSVSDGLLFRAAAMVGLDAAPLFRLLGRHVPPDLETQQAASSHQPDLVLTDEEGNTVVVEVKTRLHAADGQLLSELDPEEWQQVLDFARVAIAAKRGSGGRTT